MELELRQILFVAATDQLSNQIYDILRKLCAEVRTRGFSVDLIMDRVDKIDRAELLEKIEQEIYGTCIVIIDLTNCDPFNIFCYGIARDFKKQIIMIGQNTGNIITNLKFISDVIEYRRDTLDSFKETIFGKIADKIEIVRVVEANNTLEKQNSYIYDIKCFSSRAEVELENHFKRARSAIDILTTNLDFLFEKYSGGKRTYFDEIMTALENHEMLKVRILTLDPESDFSAKRGQQLGKDAFDFREEMRQSLKKVKKRATKYPIRRFEVRIYNEFPNQITYRIDTTIIHSVVGQPFKSRHYLAFELDTDCKGVRDSFITHFETVWSRWIKPDTKGI